MSSATPPLPILDESLTDDQQVLLHALLWHVTREEDHGPITTERPPAALQRNTPKSGVSLHLPAAPTRAGLYPAAPGLRAR